MGYWAFERIIVRKGGWGAVFGVERFGLRGGVFVATMRGRSGGVSTGELDRFWPAGG